MTTKAKLWLGVLLIFVCGSILGAVGAVLIIRHRALQALEEGPAGTRRFVMRTLTRKLALDDEQASRILPIVSDAQRELIRIHTEIRPRVEEVIASAVGKMGPVLDEAQRQKLEELQANTLKRLARREEELRDE